MNLYRIALKQPDRPTVVVRALAPCEAAAARAAAELAQRWVAETGQACTPTVERDAEEWAKAHAYAVANGYLDPNPMLETLPQYRRMLHRERIARQRREH